MLNVKFMYRPDSSPRQQQFPEGVDGLSPSDRLSTLGGSVLTAASHEVGGYRGMAPDPTGPGYLGTAETTTTADIGTQASVGAAPSGGSAEGAGQ
jgi:hypothetical protein